MRTLPAIFFTFILYVFSSCGSDNGLDIKGDEEAITLAENMILSMGGKKNWTKLKSLYIRTITTDMQTGDPLVVEEWINLDEPKFMNRRVKDNVHYFQIVNRNDGWSVQNQNVTLMQPAGVTSYLNWFDNFFMRNLKLLALGGEGVEVKMNGIDAFDMFINNKFVSGFQVNDINLPEKYVTQSPDKSFIIMNINEWGEYKGFKYPLVVTNDRMGSYFQTDYWDIGMLDAESSFNVTFDPYEIAENFR
jgi:hypothetical protein